MPDTGRIKIYSASLGDRQWLAKGLARLPGQLSDYVCNYRRSESRCRTLLGLLLTRRAVAGFMPGWNWEGYRLDEFGRPHLRDMHIPEVPDFSVAHSEEFVVCAIGLTRVGIDIEKVEARRACRLRRLLSQKRPTSDLPPTCSDRAVLAYWTRLECMAKGNGCGIWTTLNTAELGVRSGRLAGQKWWFKQVKVDSEYVCSLATLQQCSVEIEQIQPDDAVLE